MTKSIDEIIYNNLFSLICDHKRIADIGKNLLTKIPASNRNFKEYLNTNILDYIFFKFTDDIVIQHIMNSLKNSYSKGHEDFSVNPIKNCSNQLSKPLCLIFNKSMQDGIIPNDLKISKIIPIYKSVDVKAVSNYSPISILPASSKIIEKLVFNQLLDFIDIHNILSNNQYRCQWHSKN